MWVMYIHYSKGIALSMYANIVYGLYMYAFTVYEYYLGFAFVLTLLKGLKCARFYLPTNPQGIRF